MTFSESDQDLVDELAAELARIPATATLSPTWSTVASVDEIPLLSTQGDQHRVYLRFRKPDGRTLGVPYSNRETYAAKGFAWTGEWCDWGAWSVAQAARDKWRGL